MVGCDLNNQISVLNSTANSAIVTTHESDASKLIVRWQPPDDLAQYDGILLRYWHGDNTPITAEIGVNIASYTVGELEPDTEYTFSIRAVKGQVKSNEVRQIISTPDISAPAPVDQLEYRALSASSGTLFWEPPSMNSMPPTLDYQYAIVEHAGGPANQLNRLLINAPTKNVHINGMTPETEYYFTVTAYDDQDQSSMPRRITITTPPAGAPDSVRNPAVIVPSDRHDTDSLMVVWDYSDSLFGSHVAGVRIIHYKANEGPLSSGSLVEIIGTNTHSQIFERLQEDTEYIFEIRTYNDIGEIGVQVLGKTNDITAPAPIELIGAHPGDREMLLHWINPQDPDLKEVQVRYRESGSDRPERWPAIPSISEAESRNVVTGLANNTEYEFSIRTIDDDGIQSEPVFVTKRTVDSNALGAVRNLRAVVGDRHVILSWVNPSNSDLDHVEISCTPNDGCPSATIREPESGQATPNAFVSRVITGLNNDTAYTITVTPYKDTDEQFVSRTIEITPGRLGTRPNPYLVDNRLELQSIANGFSNEQTGRTLGRAESLAAHYRMTADIQLSGVFTPIGTMTEMFSGGFDGGGFTISNVNTTSGLFEAVSGTIRNVTLTNIEILLSESDGVTTAGALVGTLAAGGLVTDSSAVGGSIRSVTTTTHMYWRTGGRKPRYGAKQLCDGCDTRHRGTTNFANHMYWWTDWQES